ncbi:MAG: hypothetical protein ABJK37_08855 [Paraglaciecola sp.]|uniref:hypothetical protein n=1 Tax=Paraglaciecola sp. TaxID=1920173 RepID=UPI00329A513D
MYDRSAHSCTGKQFAFLNINGKDYRSDMGTEASVSTFTVKLQKRPLKILGWFVNNPNLKLKTDTLPAFYAYVEYLN